MNEPFSTPPKDKSELLHRIKAARAELEGYLAAQSPDTLAQPGPDGGWSALDHLAHLAGWRWKLLAMMRGHGGHVGLRIDAQTYQTAGLDGINAILYERNQPRPTAEKLADFHAAHAAVLAAIEQMDDADLQRRYDMTDPTDTRLLVDGIIGNTYGHDLEHLGWIRELLRNNHQQEHP